MHKYKNIFPRYISGTALPSVIKVRKEGTQHTSVLVYCMSKIIKVLLNIFVTSVVCLMHYLQHQMRNSQNKQQQMTQPGELTCQM